MAVGVDIIITFFPVRDCDQVPLFTKNLFVKSMKGSPYFHAGQHSLLQWNWFYDVTGCTWYSSDVREPISLHQALYLRVVLSSGHIFVIFWLSICFSTGSADSSSSYPNQHDCNPCDMDGKNCRQRLSVFKRESEKDVPYERLFKEISSFIVSVISHNAQLPASQRQGVVVSFAVNYHGTCGNHCCCNAPYSCHRIGSVNMAVTDQTSTSYTQVIGRLCPNTVYAVQVKASNRNSASALSQAAMTTTQSAGKCYPGQKKRTILEISGEKNAVPCVISCSIRRDQRRAKVADSRGSDLAQRWSLVIEHDITRETLRHSSRLESRGWFFLLSRVVGTELLITINF